MMSGNNVNVSPLPRASKRCKFDSSSNQLNETCSISSDSDLSTDSTNYSDGRSIIQEMSSIHTLCSTIGGIYDAQTTNVMFMCGDTTGDNLLIPAHKSILAADSAVFYLRFYVKSRKNNTFRIASTTPDMFCKFLTTFYTKSMKLHRVDLPELMELAYNFDGGKCKQICHKFMLKSLETGVDDVLWTLKIALKYKCQAIAVRCVEQIQKYGHFLIGTDEFLQCNRQLFNIVLSQNFLGRNETKVFAASVEWAKRRIGPGKMASYKRIRSEIGESFEMIHFDLMNDVQFIECLSEFTSIFRADEIRDIAEAICVRRECRNQSNVRNELPDVPRGRLHTIQHISENWEMDFRKLFNDHKSADMYFTFGTGDVRIAAHKCILATRSSILQQRLFEVDGPVEVLVKSANPRIFSAFLKLLYGYGIDETVQNSNLEAILTLAYEYRVLDIFKGQEAKFKRLTTMETLFWAVNLCRKYRFVDTMNFNCKWIQKHANKIDLNLSFHPMALVHCSRKIVQDALDIDYPNRNAMRIFQAVINWAKNRCRNSKTNTAVTIKNLRRKMNSVIMLIPFHKMTRTQFDACQNDYPGLLNEMETQYVLAKMMDDTIGCSQC